MKATFNRFAALDPGDNTTKLPQDEPSNDDLRYSGPVTYSFETSKWSLDNTIYHLRQFKLQNITADKRGMIFLRFSHEAQAKQVLQWLTDRIKINAKITRVSNSRADPKCYYCSRLGHWASECQESLFSMFPSELITLISAELRAPDLFDFMLCSKNVFNAIANRQKTIIVARSHWHAHYRMKLKLGLLKYFRSVEKVVLRSLRCLITAIPMNVIATQYTRLTSLTINNCSFINPNDYSTFEYLDESWVTKMTRMTQLTKLDLDRQPVSTLSYNRLHSVTHWTQLRVNFPSVGDTEVPAGLRKFSLSAINYSEDRFFREPPKELLYIGELSPLQSLHLYGVKLTCWPLMSLERLIAPYESDVFEAVNLTKLVLYNSTASFDYYSSDIMKYSLFPKLQTLMLDGIQDLQDDEFFQAGLFALTKLTLSRFRESSLNLGPLINLRTLHLVDFEDCSVTNVPQSLEVLRVTCNDRCRYQLPSNELAGLHITRFECLLSECPKVYEGMQIVPQYLNQLVHCSTLREMKIEYTDKRIMPYYAKFTQLKVLDLVHSSKSNYINRSNRPITQDDIIELSKQLPNTRIYHGFILPSTIQRPKHDGHWYHNKLQDSGLVPFYCGDCPYCLYLKRGFREEDFDDNRSAACFTPKPFKEHWSWY